MLVFEILSPLPAARKAVRRTARCVGDCTVVPLWAMDAQQPNNPLHGITLRAILEDLIQRRGWDDLAAHVRIRCFTHDPSVQSSLKFLRKTPWARQEVEALYVQDQRQLEAKRERNRRRAERRATREAHSDKEALNRAQGAEGADGVECAPTPVEGQGSD